MGMDFSDGLLVEKGIFVKRDFLSTVKRANRREELLNDSLCSFL